MELFSILVATVVILLLIFLTNQMTYWKRRGVPHVPAVPFLGHRIMNSFLGGRSFVECSLELYDQFPGAKYYGIMMMNTPVILLKDPELIRDVYIRNFDSCPDHRSFIDERMDPIFGKNVFSLRGARWREVRNALTPTFTASKMKFLFELVSQVSEDFVCYLENHPEMTDVIDTKDAFTRYTNDVIATSAFGISVDSMKDRDNEFYLRGKDATNLSGTKRILKFVASMYFPRLMRLAGQTYLSKATNDFFLNLIKSTVNYRDQNPTNIRPDMIHLLMQVRDGPGIQMNINDIVAQAFIFFLAGFDTSSTLMSFICHELAYNQEAQDRLRVEIDELMAQGNELTYELLFKMKYMDMVVQETLRLYPPVVILDRVCVKELNLPPATPDSPKCTMTPGTTAWVPAYAMHRDPKYFPNPHEFNPERFSDENKNQIPPYTYVPFGIGPRKCIGERFALMETKLIIARIVQRFYIKPSAKSTKDIIIDPKSLNLVALGGIWLKFEKRSIGV